ncbi:MAG: S-layer homology domain-containing protein [Clostridia bacterium]|nr:S-layer homology domain-containing protein [Clostridia bacterium]
MLKSVKKTLKRTGAVVLTLAIAATSTVAMPSITAGAFASPKARNMENLDRGVFACQAQDGVGNFISWRRLGTESADTVFTLYRNKDKIAEGAITNYVDAQGVVGDNYTVVANGMMSKSYTATEGNYIEIPMSETPKSDNLAMNRDGIYYSVYTPGDGTYGDLDGDGEYELIVLWCPPDAKDAASGGRTGKAYIDAYKLDGTFMWQIDMGYNIRAGAHDTMLCVADFDNDGSAELIVRTADGTIDGQGNMIGDPEKGTTYENSWAALNGGKNLQGPLYVTCFDGETGKALDTIDYYPQNTIGSMETCYSFGDDFGNRCERYNASIAYFDGQTPSVIECRGYYFGKNGRQRQAAAAYDFRNGKLSLRWAFDTEPGQDGYVKGNEYYVGQGNHQVEAADVDGDGFDEATTGALWYNEDGTVLWSSQLEHGDVVHVGDFLPTNPGLETMTAKEDYSDSAEHFDYSSTELAKMKWSEAIGADNAFHRQKWGIVLQDAKTGRAIQVYNGTKDTGRGMIANIGYGDSYYVMWGAAGTGYHDDKGNVADKITANGGWLSMNGRIYWDGDLQDELQDHLGAGREIRIEKWDDAQGKRVDVFVPEGSHSVNSTKGNTSGQGDMLGDWREEFVSYVITHEEESVEKIEIPANWDKTIIAEVATPVKEYALRLYSTNIPTEYNYYTLAHDDIYRNSSGAYNNCYNQPPHISWYANDHLDKTTYVTQPESRATLVKNNYTPKAFDANALPAAGDVQRPTVTNKPQATAKPVVNLAPGEFTDTVNHWAKSYISDMGKAGYINGMGDGTFRPDASITKGQFIKMIVAAMGLPVSGTVTGENWAEPYVNIANAANIISKRIDVASMWARNQNITRQEMASVVANAAEYLGKQPANASSNFNDNSAISDWAKADIAEASTLGIIRGFEDGSFKPAQGATRAQAATMLSNFVKVIKAVTPAPTEEVAEEATAQ